MQFLYKLLSLVCFAVAILLGLSAWVALFNNWQALNTVYGFFYNAGRLIGSVLMGVILYYLLKLALWLWKK